MATNNAINGKFGGNNGQIPTTTVQAGNPNTVVAGSSFAGVLGDIYFDTTGIQAYTCTTPGASGTAVWTATSGGASAFIWNNVTSGAQTMAPNNGYIANNASGATAFTLPTTIAIGQRVSISGATSSSWNIVQGTGQLIHFGSVTTTTGSAGSLSSTNLNDQVDLICTVANTTFEVRNAIGNITYV